MPPAFAPGSLVAAWGREWVVIETLSRGALSVRPLGGLDNETQILLPALEADLKSATFDLPSSDRATERGSKTPKRCLAS